MRYLSFVVLLSWLAMVGWNTTIAQPNTQQALLVDSLTVWVFLAVDCPITQKYIGELQRMDSVYATRKLRICGVIPGKIASQEVKTFVDEYNIRFPVQIDRDFIRVRKLHATITPEVFLFDQQGQLVYQGAIDNWFFDLGKYRQRVTEHYLQNAIDAVLQGTRPAVQKTEAVGCPIQAPQ